VTTHAEARFLGKQDPDYHYDHLYQLRLRQSWGGKITVTATHGYDFKPVAGTSRTYVNLADFLQEWTLIRAVHPRKS